MCRVSHPNTRFRVPAARGIPRRRRAIRTTRTTTAPPRRRRRRRRRRHPSPAGRRPDRSGPRRRPSRGTRRFGSTMCRLFRRRLRSRFPSPRRASMPLRRGRVLPGGGHRCPRRRCRGLACGRLARGGGRGRSAGEALQGISAGRRRRRHDGAIGGAATRPGKHDVRQACVGAVLPWRIARFGFRLPGLSFFRLLTPAFWHPLWGLRSGGTLRAG